MVQSGRRGSRPGSIFTLEIIVVRIKSFPKRDSTGEILSSTDYIYTVLHLLEYTLEYCTGVNGDKLMCC